MSNLSLREFLAERFGTKSAGAGLLDWMTTGMEYCRAGSAAVLCVAITASCARTNSISVFENGIMGCLSIDAWAVITQRNTHHSHLVMTGVQKDEMTFSTLLGSTELTAKFFGRTGAHPPPT